MDRRTILAFVLIGLITVGYIWYTQKTRPAPQPAPAPGPTAVESATGAAPSAPAPAPAPKGTAMPVTQAPVREDIPTEGEGLYYDLHWTNVGGCLKSARLVTYPEKKASAEGVLLLERTPAGRSTFGLDDPSGKIPLAGAAYHVTEQKDSIAFTAQFENGLKVTKEFRFKPESYDVGVKLTFENTGDAPIPLQYRLWAAARVVPERIGDTNPLAAIGWRATNGGVGIDTIAPGKAKNKPVAFFNSAEKPILWAGAENRYFAAVLSPVLAKDAASPQMVSAAEVSYLQGSEGVISQWGGANRVDNVAVSLLSAERSIAAHTALTDEYTAFLGPKKQEILAQPQHANLPGLLDYGMVGFISRPLLGLLDLFYKIIPNYGIGIILLTILVKVCLFPLTRKGQVSMHRMQRLQPHVKSLQEKYKDDRQRQGREMMDLYRKHNANPMSGCLPLMLQFPIFWALYRMLGNSIDLRQEGLFPVWITDLSLPDTVAFVHGWPINILPVLMVVSWVVQQMTMPKPADPQQAQMQKMMMFMPIAFGFALYGTASGLTLYWLVNTFLGIIEQRMIKAQIKHMEASGHFEAKEPVEAPVRPKKHK